MMSRERDGFDSILPDVVPKVLEYFQGIGVQSEGLFVDSYGLLVQHLHNVLFERSHIDFFRGLLQFLLNELGLLTGHVVHG